MALKCVLFLVALNVVYVTSADTKVEFEKPSIEVSEEAGVVQLTVVRTGKELNGVSKVKYATKGGTANPGIDFVAVSGTLVFLSGEDKKTISVQLVDNVEPKDERHFTVQLSEVTVGDAKNDAVELGANKTIKVTIKDNDS